MAKPKTPAVKNETIAAKLYRVETQLAELEAEKEQLRDMLLENMKKQHVTQIKLEDGTMYVRSTRKNLTIVKGFEDKAIAWAKEHYALKVDTARAKEIMRHTLEPLPEGFKESVTEYLSIKRPTQYGVAQ